MYQLNEQINIVIDIDDRIDSINLLLDNITRNRNDGIKFRLNLIPILNDYLLNLSQLENNHLLDNINNIRPISSSNIPLITTIETLSNKLINKIPSLSNTDLDYILNLMAGILSDFGIKIYTMYFSNEVLSRVKVIYRFRVEKSLSPRHFLLTEIPIGSENLIDIDTDDWITILFPHDL